MRAKIHWGMVVLTAVLLTACNQMGRCGEGARASAKSARAAPSIAGIWQAETVSMAPPDGGRRQIQGKEAAFNVTITPKTLTMRVRDKRLAEMSYVLDAKQKPWAIDLKSANGVMLGICLRNGDRLRISLNDQAEGRPRDFNEGASGMVLNLTAAEVESLFTINADGSGRSCLLTMPDYTTLGSPNWSRDGRRIAFDAWKSIYGEGLNDSHVLVVDAYGGGLKDLGPGCMPSWSLDGKQLAYSSYGPERGVCIMKADGSDRRCIAPNGWGVRWSPKRNELAYTAFDNGRDDMCIYDVAKEKSRLLLERGYASIRFGFSWSPDGEWLCFKGWLPEGGAEIAAVRAAGEKKGFKVILTKSAMEGMTNAGEPLAWGGNGNQILLSIRPRNSDISRLYVVDFKDGQPPRLFPGVPGNFALDDMAWSPDGKKVVFTGRLTVREAARRQTQTTTAGNQFSKDAKQADRATNSVNNLKQIALAMLNHESACREFPAPAIRDRNGKPLLSWRVRILPYIDQAGLYKQFHLDEPWDSPHNRRLIGKMPWVYRCPLSRSNEPGRTNYLLPVGNGAAFTAGKPTVLPDISDGTSDTLMVLEVDDDRAVIWTKPDDWQYDPKEPFKGLGKLDGGKFHTAFFDGSAHEISTNIKPAVMRDLIERADGHPIDPSEF